MNIADPFSWVVSTLAREVPFVVEAASAAPCTGTVFDPSW
jgi:hypothetical protein